MTAVETNHHRARHESATREKAEHGDDHPVNRLYNEVQQARQHGADKGTGGGGTFSNSEHVRDALTGANHYVHSHGFPNVFITGTGEKGELVGKDDHGNKVHIRDGGKHGIKATDNSGHAVAGDQGPGDGNGHKVTVPNDQGGGRINSDGSGVYNVEGGKQGAWGATRQVLEAQAHQQGHNDYHASNTDIANAQRKMASAAGYHGKNAVNEWAKHLKPGDMHAPAADLRAAGFSDMPKGQGEQPYGGPGVPNRDVTEQKSEPTGPKTKRETEQGYLNDSRVHYWGGGMVKDALHGIGDFFGSKDIHDAANSLEMRTPYTTSTERDGSGVKSFTTKYGGEGAEVQVRTKQGQDITLSRVTEAHGERASNGRFRMTWTIDGKVHHGHLSPEGKAEYED